MNHSVLVGRLATEPELKEIDNGSKVVNVILAVSRGYKNINGEYDTDFIPCVLWKGIAENISKYCSKGDLVGVKGNLRSKIYDKEDGSRNYIVELAVDKLTFLSTKKAD
mgnify:CR=1 FL=1